jgi:hypothetical protein
MDDVKRGEVLQVRHVLMPLRRSPLFCKTKEANQGKPLWQKAIQMPYGFEPTDKRYAQCGRMIQKTPALIDSDWLTPVCPGPVPVDTRFVSFLSPMTTVLHNRLTIFIFLACWHSLLEPPMSSMISWPATTRTPPHPQGKPPL